MYRSDCIIVVIVFMLILEDVACITCNYYSSKPNVETIVNPYQYEPRNYTAEATQTVIKCVHGYQNGNQQKEIASFEGPMKLENNRKFIIKVEKFDNNTEIYCVKDKYEMATNVSLFSKIGETTNVLKWPLNSATLLNVQNENPTIEEELINLKYNETKNVSFSCQEYINKTKYLQLGIINTTSNIIETSNVTTLNQTLNITHNATILCCIYYMSNDNDSNTQEIIRYVTKKTLLVYANGNKKDGLEDKIGNIAKHTENKTSTASTNPDDTDSSDPTKIYKIVSAVVLTVFIVVIIITIWKRRCRKKPKSDHKVLYAELDLHRRTEPGTSTRPDIRQRPNPEEESPYAQIIGEMRPK